MKAKLTVIKPESLSNVPVLEVRDVSIYFDTAVASGHVLKTVCFSAMANQITCIIGRSGCGKTTLLNVLAGFLTPSSGSVLINGETVRGPGTDRCVVFQEDTLFPWLTVRENIEFGLTRRVTNRHDRNSRVDRMLTLVGLLSYQHYLPREISGGMKQRVELARVLILEPQVLLMDEPFASLDYYTRREMQNLLIDLWQQHRQTILFVTHDIDEAITLADRILVMNSEPGSIREDLPASFARPRTVENPECVLLRRNLYDILCS